VPEKRRASRVWSRLLLSDLVACAGVAAYYAALYMRKSRAILRDCLAAILLPALAPLVYAAQPATIPVEPIRLSPHCWYVRGASGQPSLENQGFTANAGFVVTADGVVVFDALGTPPLGEALLRAIRSVTDQPIRRVIVSHYHADHYYGLQALKAQGAEVWAHESAKPYLESDAPALRLSERRSSLASWVDESARIVWPDVWIGDEASFEMGGLHFRVYHVGPAHTPEDLALIVVEEGIFFAGDLMFGGRVPFVGEADSKAWLDAIDKLEKHQPRILVGGHGEASANAAADLNLTREYLIYLRSKMGAAVQDFVPFEEAYAATDWSAFSHLPAFEAANRRNAYNTYLLMERELLAR
jgi:glyoxylase-like metal-dependent hydrolase (beta-lactamase superfamily II)